jgi:hypothetical protein|tara:strand:- start:156 stop:449 length:294 start_codon:yes stop_codon:yes gene_type:complete
MYNTILGFIDKNGGNLDDPALLKELNTHRNSGKISLPKVKLKNNLNEKRGPFLSTQSSGFSGLKRNLIDRHASKANIGDHLKHKLGRGGSQFGTVIP